MICQHFFFIQTFLPWKVYTCLIFFLNRTLVCNIICIRKCKLPNFITFFITCIGYFSYVLNHFFSCKALSKFKKIGLYGISIILKVCLRIITREQFLCGVVRGWFFSRRNGLQGSVHWGTASTGSSGTGTKVFFFYIRCLRSQ